MLHTKFRENRPACSGEDFLRVFTIYGHGGHLSHVTRIMLIKFSLWPQLRRSLGGILVWACPSVCPSVCYTCTRSRTVRDRILKFGM